LSGLETLAARLAGESPDEYCMDGSQTLRFVRILKVVAEPTRLRIISLLAEAGDGITPPDLKEVLGLSQPAIWHHLGMLRGAGLVSREKTGAWRAHILNHEAFQQLADDLNSLAPMRSAKKPR